MASYCGFSKPFAITELKTETLTEENEVNENRKSERFSSSFSSFPSVEEELCFLQSAFL